MTTLTISTGFSAAAHMVGRAQQRGREYLERAAAFSKQAAYDELAEVWNECRIANWDGENALPITQDALRNAYEVIESLPLGMPLPSVGVEPDGHVTLEWYRYPRWTLSVSVSPEGVLHYAALFGAANHRGSEEFTGDLSPTLKSLIRRVCNA